MLYIKKYMVNLASRLIEKFVSSLLLTVSIFLLVYIFYKSEIVYSGDKRDYYEVYYFISISLLIFSVYFNFIKDKSNIIIILISIFIAIYITELYLTLKPINSDYEKINEKSEILKKKTGKIYEKRHLYDYFNDLKIKDKKLAVIIPPTYHLKNRHINIYPLSGISNSKTIFCNENGYYSNYYSDRYGFNNPDKVWNSPNTDYLLLGDSFVHGACVNKPNDIASILRNLSNKKVINLSYSSNGPLINYSTFREYMPLNIKKVIWFYYEGNDKSDLNSELKNQILIKYLENLNFDQKLSSRQKDIDNLGREIIQKELANHRKKKAKHQDKYKIKGKKIKFDYIKFVKLNLIRSKLNYYLPKKYKPKIEIGQPDEFEKKIPKQYVEILSLMEEASLEKNFRFYFVYLPEYNRYKKKSYTDESRINMINILKKLNIDFIDLHEEVFKKEENPLELFPFEMYGHYNIKGYQKITKKIYEMINQ